MRLLRGRLQPPGPAGIEPAMGDPVDDAREAQRPPRAWVKSLRKEQAALAGEASAAAAEVEHPPPIPDRLAGGFFAGGTTLRRGPSAYTFARGSAAPQTSAPMDR